MRVNVPGSKKYLVEALKREFGGSIHISPAGARAMWQLTSNEDLTRLKEATEKAKPWLPPESYQQLTAFLSTFI